jgi:type I restriction enzyme S subunit
VKQRDYLAEGRIPVIDQGQSPVGGYTNDDDFAFIGDLPVVLFGDHTRAVKLVDQRFAVGADGIKIFRPAEGVRAKYLYYWMKSAPLPDRGYGRHYQYLRELSLPLPPPKEQDEIVAELEKQFSRLDEAVANLKRVKGNLKRYKAATLKAAVTGHLMPLEDVLARREKRSYENGDQLMQRILKDRRALAASKGKYKEPAPVNANLPEQPLGWTWATIESLTTKVSDGVHKKPVYRTSGVPFVTVKNLTAGEGISFEELNYISEEDHREFCKRTHPERGDLLLSKDGTLGVVRLVNTDRAFSIFVSVALVKPVLKEMSRYLEIALESPILQEQMVPKGSGLQHIHLEDLRQDCVPVPPLSEQRRIVAEVDRRLSIVREFEAEVDANLKRAQALRQAVLARHFQGRS